MRALRILAAIVAFGLTIASAAANADTLRPGYLELTQRSSQHWQVTWKAPLLGGLASRAEPEIPAFCRIDAQSSRLQDASLVTTGVMTCDQPLMGADVGIAGMEASFTDALLRIAPLGSPVQVERLTADRAIVTVAAAPNRWQVAGTYLLLGIEHILAGYDHLLFVVALVLLLMRGLAVVKAATAFTVAHSITLAGTTLGFLGLAQAPVEALIALSIIFLAVEIAKQGPGRPRLTERAGWILAFLFGLLHGFGFAGALREIGVPDGDVAIALLTFNLGVETGQLLIIAVCLLTISACRKLAPNVLRPAVVTASYVIGTIAAFWFFERISGSVA